MTSINTNIAAQTALRTLQSTNAQLDQTQSRISTGLKIGEAKDNAAYWSISTTLKSDNKALGTVKDALSLGAATVDTAYQGLNSTLDVLNEMKSKLTAATQDGVNKAAVQAEISQLQKQLESIAGSAIFSGENWLKSDSGTGDYSPVKSVVASFDRDANGSVSVGTIGFDITDSVLYDAEDGGLLQKKSAINSTTAAFTQPAAVTADQTVTITYGGSDVALTVTRADIEAIGNGDNVLNSASELASILRKKIAENDVLKGNVSVGVDAANLTFTSVGKTVATAAMAGVGLADGTEDATPGRVSVATIDVSAASGADISAYLKIVNTAIDGVTSAASSLGAVASRIELQQTFVSNLMDTIDQGVSGLVDADMNEESTRLQALQVKQQLGVQALSIANQSAQNVLRLFQ